MNNHQMIKIDMKLLKKNVLHNLLLFITLTTMCSSFAQSNWRGSVGTQLYFAYLNTDNGALDTNYEPGIGINLGVSYTFNETWSIHSGLNVSYLETSTSTRNYSDQVDAIDIEGEDFEFRYRLNNYSENQKSTVLSVPVAFQYESKGGQTRFYTRLGASVNVFLSPTSEGQASRLTTSGFFERFNGELTAPRFAGFGTFEDVDFAENDLEINNSYNAFIEIGIKERFGSNTWIYLSLFAEYGLNNLIENNNSSLIDYDQNAPIDFINNSSLNTSIQTSGTALFEDVTLNIIGFRVKYEFGI